jgi:hypothetical protein
MADSAPNCVKCSYKVGGGGAEPGRWVLITLA